MDWFYYQRGRLNTALARVLHGPHQLVVFACEAGLVAGSRSMAARLGTCSSPNVADD